MNKQMLQRSALLATTVLVVVASTVTAVQAASLCVHPTGAGQCFNSIQAAVDAADDGDRIVIRPGTYVEQVVIIDKDLTLIGRPGAVVQAFPDMAETLLEATGVGGRSVIGVAHADVTIRGLIIDGANLSESNLFLDGIDLINAGGVLRDNVIKNVGFGEPTVPVDENGQPVYQGDAIFVLNLSATHRTVTIVGNRTVNFNNNGMTLISVADPEQPDAANLTLHVARNTVIGAGPTDVIDQFGIYIASDGFADPSLAAIATVRNNVIRDIVTVAPYAFPGSGIVADQTTQLEIGRNVIWSVNLGIQAAFAHDARIWHNVLTGAGQDVPGTTGIALSGSDIEVSGNWIRRFETGIMLHVDHPFFGAASATNTSLDNNRFSNVGVDIRTGPAVASPADAGLPVTSLKRAGYESRLHR